ncbi:MAG: hypothetical protein CL693_19965 [Cellvibrionaceae bacterium]|nr:hypothetical protein [Cellvibrionaceae bacterium]|tara:strand:+ start:6150 stop:7970 length:1821 start_codon:yes stop_codon:yes gene_type:complete
MDELKRTIRYQCLAAVAAILVSIFQIFADPFGLASTTDRLSSLLFSALASPFYGTSYNPPAENYSTEYSDRLVKGRDEIVILLFDDQYLEHNEWQWPLSPFTHAQLLQSIVDSGAQSVFVDLSYVADSKERSQSLGRMMSAANDLWIQDQVPVFFAGMMYKPVPEFDGVPAAHSALVEMYAEDYQYLLKEVAFEKHEHAHRGEHSHQDAHDHRHQSEHEHRHEDQLLHQNSHMHQHEHGYKSDTAAYAIYKHWCKSHSCPTFTAEDEAKTMFIQWGYAPAGSMARYYQKTGVECQAERQGFFSGVWQSLKLFVVHAFNGFSGNWRPSCLYHTNVSLLLPTESPEALSTLVKDKIVLLGAHLKQYPDISESPVHGQVPGVFWHAAALDNLIEFGPNFLVDDQSRSSEFNEAIASSLVLILFTAFSVYMDFRQSRVAESERLRMNVKFGVTVVLLLSMLVSSLIYFTRSAPTNWIGIAALLLIVNPEPFKALWKTSWFRLGRANIMIFHRDSNLNTLLQAVVTALGFSAIWVLVIGVLLGPLVYFSLHPDTSIWLYTAMTLIYGAGAVLTLYLMWFSHLRQIAADENRWKTRSDKKRSDKNILQQNRM